MMRTRDATKTKLCRCYHLWWNFPTICIFWIMMQACSVPHSWPLLSTLLTLQLAHCRSHIGMAEYAEMLWGGAAYILVVLTAWAHGRWSLGIDSIIHLRRMMWNINYLVLITWPWCRSWAGAGTDQWICYLVWR